MSRAGRMSECDGGQLHASALGDSGRSWSKGLTGGTETSKAVFGRIAGGDAGDSSSGQEGSVDPSEWAGSPLQELEVKMVKKIERLEK